MVGVPIAVVALLTSCSTLPEDGTDAGTGTRALAPLAVPDRWSAVAGPVGLLPAETPTDLSGWWQRFDDAGLSRWTQAARRDSPRVAAAEAAWRQALALRDAAAAAASPTLGATASAGYDRQGSGSTRQSEQRFQAGLNAQWVPDLFGAQASALAAAEAAQLASRAAWGDVQGQVAGEAALAYIDLRTQQARLALARHTLDSQRKTLQITEWRLQAGLVSMLERDQARAAAAQVEALLPALQTAIAQGGYALAALAGQPPAAGDDTAGPTSSLAAENVASGAASGAGLGADPAATVTSSTLPTIPVAGEDVTLAIPAETLRQRADVRAAELEVIAARSRVDQAQAQRWPSLSLSGSIGVGALTLGALGDGASLVSSLLAGLSLPLFDGGARVAQVRAQSAALDQAHAQYRAAVAGALQAVEDALAALRGARQRGAALDTAAVAAANAATLARLRFTSGLVDFQTVLDTQRTTFSAQDAVLGARADLARSQVLLILALGGGWPADARIATATERR